MFSVVTDHRMCFCLLLSAMLRLLLCCSRQVWCVQHGVIPAGCPELTPSQPTHPNIDPKTLTMFARAAAGKWGVYSTVFLQQVAVELNP
jgi:hypothetical protein